jgi:hypothetical protein
LAAVILTGCAHVTTLADVSRPTKPPALASEATQVRLPRDIRACAGVQALVAHITASTARWSPALHPFDKAIAAQIRGLSQDLQKQAPQAQTVKIQDVVQSNGRAFAAVADAMSGKDASLVNHAIQGTKVSYRELAKVCALTSHSG